MNSKFLISILILLMMPEENLCGNFSNHYNPVREYTNQTIWDLPDVSEENMDIGLWSLIIAKEYDSTIDIPYYLNELEKMKDEIDRMIAGRNMDMIKFVMTKMYQFDEGIWNNFQPYSYDLDDPLGENPQNKLLSTYIDTRKGNCVSMPTLFLALMERVDPDIPFHGVRAPMHLFCRLHDRQDGKIWNAEATTGGHADRDVWYVEEFNISQASIDSGTYMTDLTKKEFVACLIDIIITKYRFAGEYEKAMEYSDLILQIDPQCITGLVHKGALFAWLGYNFLENIKQENRRPTPEEHEVLTLYEAESEKYINRAMSLGWRPETPEEKEKYLKSIEEARQSIKE